MAIAFMTAMPICGCVLCAGRSSTIHCKIVLMLWHSYLLILVLSGEPQASTIVCLSLSSPPVLNLVSAVVRRTLHNLYVPHVDLSLGARRSQLLILQTHSRLLCLSASVGFSTLS